MYLRLSLHITPHGQCVATESSWPQIFNCLLEVVSHFLTRLSLVEVLVVLRLDRFAKATADFSKEFGSFSGSRVDLVGAIDIDGDDGTVGMHGKHRGTELEVAELSVVSSGPFGKEDDLFALLEKPSNSLD